MMTEAGRRQLDMFRQEQGLDESLPWGGRSPRSLTRVAMGLTRAGEGVSFTLLGDDAYLDFDEEVLNDQYRRFRWKSPSEGRE